MPETWAPLRQGGQTPFHRLTAMRETWHVHLPVACRTSLPTRIGGLALFAIATTYAAYQVVRGRPDPMTWNALAWVILLFTAFNGVSRTLEEDRPAVLAYLKTVVNPVHYLVARTLHNSAVLAGLACLLTALMGLLMGWGTLEGPRLWGFLAGMALTALALGATLTLIALIAARAGAGFGMTAVLGLPLVLPCLGFHLLGKRPDARRVGGRHLAQFRISRGIGGRFRDTRGRALPVPLARAMSMPNSPSSPTSGVRLIRATGVLLLGYVLVMTFTVPLGPGIVDVRVSPGEDVGRQTTFNLDIEGHNTHFSESIPLVFLKRGEHFVVIRDLEAVDDRHLAGQVTLDK